MNVFIPIALTVVGTLSSITVSFIIFYLSRNKKRLSYEKLSISPLLDSGPNKQDLQVLYKNKPVNEAKSVVLKIWNSGTVSIKEEDFVDNLVISFDKDIEVLGANIYETNPECVKKYTRISHNTLQEVIIEKLLINRGDTIYISILVNDNTPGDVINPKVEGRIVGLKRIQQSNSNKVPLSIGILLFIVIFITTGISIFEIITRIILKNNAIILKTLSDVSIYLIVLNMISFICAGGIYYIYFHRNKTAKTFGQR